MTGLARLEACDQSTGQDYLVRQGDLDELRLTLNTDAELFGRDQWIITPTGEKILPVNFDTCCDYATPLADQIDLEIRTKGHDLNASRAVIMLRCLERRTLYLEDELRKAKERAACTSADLADVSV